MAIDISDDVIVVVGAEEHILKSRDFSRLCGSLKRFRRVGSDRKQQYLKSFMRRYMRYLRDYLSVVRILRSVDDVNELIRKISPAVIVVDDKIYGILNHPVKIRESSPKPKYMDYLLLIADNLANYFRKLLKENLSAYVNELREIEK